MENVFRFTYLGSQFYANDKQEYDIKVRIALAMKRCGQLKHMFDSPEIGPRLKIRLYTVTVCSLLTYGCESWTLSDKVMRMINGANSQMLSRITGHNVMQEARRATTSYDILTHIRRMRLTWLGQILRSNPNSMLFRAVEMQRDMDMTGNLL